MKYIGLEQCGGHKLRKTCELHRFWLIWMSWQQNGEKLRERARGSQGKYPTLQKNEKCRFYKGIDKET